MMSIDERGAVMTQSYLDMMEESLDQKIEILEKASENNNMYKVILESDGNLDVNAIQQSLDEKSIIIDRINELNNGFTALFGRVEQELENNKEMYKDQIRSMQDKIRRISDLSASIEVQEERNKKLTEKYLGNEHGRLKNNKLSAGAAYSYYETMSKSRIITPQFYDKKK